jgi:hypothetical protein
MDNRPRQQNFQGPRPKGNQQRHKQDEVKVPDETVHQIDSQMVETAEKAPKVSCFNCAQWGTLAQIAKL